MSEDPDKTGAVKAGETDAAGASDAKADAQEQRTESHARGVELREEIAITDPKAHAAAAKGSRAQLEPQTSSADAEGPPNPERHLAAAFVGAFLLARVLKRITS